MIIPSSANDGKNITQIVVVFSVSISLFIAGIHGGWPGPSLLKLLSDEYPFDINDEELSYIAIIGPFGNIIGGILSASLVDIIGRKKTILSLAVPQLFNCILLYFSYYEKLLLYFGRVFGGMGEGGSLCIIPLYIAEVSEPKIRGMLGTVVPLLYLLGKLFINVLGSYVDIHTTALIGLSFTVLFVLTFTKMPETPYYYIMKQEKGNAEKALQFLRRKKDIQKEMDQITHDVNRQMSESGKYSDIFKIKSNRKAFLILLFTRIFQQFTGLTAFSIYLQILIKEGTNFSPVLGSSLVLGTQMVGNIISTSTIDKFGRKPLYIFSSSSCFLVLLGLGIFFTLRDNTSIDTSQVSFLPLVLFMLFILGFQPGFGCGMNILISELYSASIKSKALSIGSVIFSVMMILSTKFYQFTSSYFGMAVPFYGFASVTFISILFFVFFLPETKGKTFERIQQELNGNKT